MVDAWYLPATEYYVDESREAEYPARQGDIFHLPSVAKDWLACQLIHPTCELGKQAVTQLQVIRVRKLTELPDRQQPAVTAGWEEREGAVRIAFAHTFFLPPVGRLATADALFSDFREIRLVDKAALLTGRLAALTHDARVTFIRRAIYFRFRLAFTSQDVFSWEAARIAGDPEFTGPRPAWAQLQA